MKIYWSKACNTARTAESLNRLCNKLTVSKIFPFFFLNCLPQFTILTLVKKIVRFCTSLLTWEQPRNGLTIMETFGRIQKHNFSFISNEWKNFWHINKLNKLWWLKCDWNFNSLELFSQMMDHSCQILIKVRRRSQGKLNYIIMSNRFVFVVAKKQVLPNYTNLINMT